MVCDQDAPRILGPRAARRSSGQGPRDDLGAAAQPASVGGVATLIAVFPRSRA
jgi:hypothetical protein